MAECGCVLMFLNLKHFRPHCGPDDRPIVVQKLHTMHFNPVSFTTVYISPVIKTSFIFSLPFCAPVSKICIITNITTLETFLHCGGMYFYPINTAVRKSTHSAICFLIKL